MIAKLITWNSSVTLSYIFKNKGLHHDDILYETEAVKEAIRRLPQNLQDDRNFRMMRALHLSMTKTILPKDQWTKYEEG